MRVALRSCGVLAVTLVSLAGCGGDEAASGAATRFESSACKTKSGGQGLLAAAQQVTPHDGLRCVTWERRDGGQVRFGLSNFEGGCGVQYAGQAFLSDGGRAVALSLTNPGGAVAACGWCVYDFAFDVKDVPAGADLAVTVERSNSAQRSEETPLQFQLPAQAADRGVVCDYGHPFAMIQLAEATGKVGQRHWPCTGINPGDAPRCQPGTSCQMVDQQGVQHLCLTDCTDDAGCGDALFACRDGACRLRTPPR
jgi:hypothetical protein